MIGFPYRNRRAFPFSITTIGRSLIASDFEVTIVDCDTVEVDELMNRRIICDRMTNGYII